VPRPLSRVLLSEILIFLKWYVAVRRRITPNSLQLLLNKVNSSGFNPLNQSEADEKIVKNHNLQTEPI
jgi:hypothetical protein